jgi:2-C-methyl-D-erythritol 4-phosphate cytidylyltransferase/2-C-methyl-D-erythritol 2,4-cyclodiphosphate synthase
LSDLTLILLAAGSSSRFEFPVKKQWLRIDHDPLWHFVTKRLVSTNLFTKIIITAHHDEVEFMKHYTSYEVISGGATRQHSLQNALQHVTTSYVMVSDIARACIDHELLERIIAQKECADCIVPVLHVNDTVVYRGQTIDRDDVKRVQTPQLSRTATLKKALQSSTVFTDESSAIVDSGGTRAFVEGDTDAHKITYISDLIQLPCIKPPSTQTLMGNGFDVHAFEENKPMVLCGTPIASDFGFKAHSDGDVGIHALIDALLGAAGMGDIGMLFPDSDASYENIDSTLLLKEVVTKLHNFGYVITNVDITIAAEVPRLARYKAKMRQRLSEILHVELSRTNIKATTTEKLGFIGRKEGVAVMATATLNYYNWIGEQ